MSIDATYFDGRSSRCRPITLALEPGGRVHLRGQGIGASYSLAELRISSRLGDVPRSVYLPDGGKCETLDNAAIDSYLLRERGGFDGARVHELESHLHYVFAALAICVALLVAFIQYGIPAAAERIAFAIPVAADQGIGEQGLALIDQQLLTPSELDPDTQQRLQRRFRDMVEIAGDAGHGYRLEFRAGGPVGANAFALPSGIVVVTDELVGLAESDEEVVAVLAHEIGHVVHRHALRGVLQNASAFLVVGVLLGDIGAISGAAGAIPTLLLESKYSRQFETEADRFAYEHMPEFGVAPYHFAHIMRRLAADESAREQGVLDYFSTHPDSEERAARFEGPGGLPR